MCIMTYVLFLYKLVDKRIVVSRYLDLLIGVYYDLCYVLYVLYI